MRLTARPLLLVTLPLLVASPLTNPLQAQGGAVATTQQPAAPAASTAPAAPTTAPVATETYESLVQRAAEARRRARSENTTTAKKSLEEARDLYVKAVDRAADDENKAGAYIQAGEISVDLNDYSRAYRNFTAVLPLKNVSAPVRIKATLLEASTYREDLQRRYQWPGSAYLVRYVYERALKIPELSGEQRLEVQTYLAENYAVENKRFEAAREYEKISKAQAANKEASLTSLRLAAYWIGPEHADKGASTTIKPADALPIVNGIYTELLKREPAAKKSVLQLDWARALMLHYNADEALTVLADLRDDSVLPVAERKEVLTRIASSQAAAYAYDKALSTWDMLGKLPGTSQTEMAQVASERATLFVKAKKEPEARAELQRLVQMPITPANKVKAWHETGLSNSRQREARAKAKAPEVELLGYSTAAQTAFENAFNIADGPLDARIDALIERANIDAGAQRIPAAREWLQKGLAVTPMTPAAKQRLLYLIAKTYGFEKNHTEALTTYQLASAEPATNYKADIGKSLQTALSTSFGEKNWDAARNYLNELEKQKFASAAGVLYDRANIENQAGNKAAALAAINSLEATYGAQLNATDKASIAALRKQIEPPPVSLTGN